MRNSKKVEVALAGFGVILSLIIFVMLTSSCSKIELPDIDATRSDTDDLRVSLVNLTNESGHHDYTFVCTKDTNELRFGSPFESGTIHLTVKDNNGALLFNDTFTSFTGQRYTLIGEPGDWDVDIQLFAVTGTIGMTLKPLE